MSGKPQRKGPKVANTSGEDQYGVYDDPLVCLDSVTGLQTELDSLSEKCAEEILQVEQKYNALRKPFLEQRTEMIRNIPDFWLNVVSTSSKHGFTINASTLHVCSVLN